MAWWREAAFLAILAGCGDPVERAAIDLTPRVAVVPVDPAPTAIERRLTGVTEARRDAVLTAVRGGLVVAVPGAVGATVAEDAPLVRLDDREARANLAAAEAAVLEAGAARDEAERQLRRIEAIEDGASESTLDSARTGLERARAAATRAVAQRDLARLALDHTVIRAPFDGEIAAIDAEKGELVGPGTLVARVVDRSALRVRVGLVADELPGASQATWQVRAGERTAEAALVGVAAAADPRTLTWEAELTVPAEVLAAGEPVTVVAALPVPACDGTVPLGVLDEGAVWTVADGVVHRVPVRVVAERGSLALIEGVPAGSRVVAWRPMALVDGGPVVVVEAPP